MDSANFSGSLWVRDGAATGPRQPGPVAHTLLPPTTCGPRGRVSLITSSGCTLPFLGHPGPNTQEGFASTAKQWRDPVCTPLGAAFPRPGPRSSAIWWTVGRETGQGGEALLASWLSSYWPVSPAPEPDPSVQYLLDEKRPAWLLKCNITENPQGERL